MLLKKFIVLLPLFYLILIKPAQAQNRMISGIFPDVSITDVEGNNHRIYDQLEKGKAVIIDVFATWCGPCWEYHESNELQTAFELYGPDGSDELAIYFVEGDLNTDEYSLQGIGANTLGDFIECSPFPLFDDHVFPFEMGIHNFPTLLFICPNKEMIEIGQLSTLQIEALLQSGCPTQEIYNNVDLLYFSSNLEPSCGNVNYIPAVLVQNNGVNTVSHLSLQLKKNGSVVVDSVGFDLFLGRYETIELPFSIENISRSSSFEASVLTVNQTVDSEGSKDTLIAEKPFLNSTSDKIKIEIVTDNFGYEVLWHLEDELGNIIASGGNELVEAGAQHDLYDLLQSGYYYASNTLIEESVYLGNEGCYTFVIYDDWGDGLCCNHGEGSFRILDKYGEVIVENELFLADHQTTFSFQTSVSSASEYVTQPRFTVFPNPCTNYLNIEFPEKSMVNSRTFSIINSLGTTVRSFNLDNDAGSNLQVNLEGLANGTYYLSESTTNKDSSIPFVIFNP